MKNFAAAHKKGCFLFLCIFLVFLGCFSFPAINLTKHFPPQISLLNLFVVLFGYYEMGQMAAAVFAQKVCRKSVLLTLIMTLTGFICRFFLEFGEVSNSYNFTLPNVAVHLFLALVIILVPVLMLNENCSC